MVVHRRPGKLEQFRLLFTRSWRQITRSTGANVARAASNIFSALVFGALFYQMGRCVEGGREGGREGRSTGVNVARAASFFFGACVWRVVSSDGQVSGRRDGGREGGEVDRRECCEGSN